MSFDLKAVNFSLEKTLFSGQCFRFEVLNDCKFLIFSGKDFAVVQQVGEILKFENSTCNENFWSKYFDLNFDYGKILQGFVGDVVLESAVSFCGRLHILNQDPFETLISFLLSSNNNIVRIKKIVSILCERFGEKFQWGFAFPEIESLKNCTLNDLSVLKAGYRTKYIYDAICKINSKEVDLEKLWFLNVDDARKNLMKIKGVGVKVANCVLLFAYHKFEVFPVDVWIKRVISMYYKLGLSKQVLSCPGFAQQLLYYSKREGVI